MHTLQHKSNKSKNLFSQKRSRPIYRYPYVRLVSVNFLDFRICWILWLHLVNVFSLYLYKGEREGERGIGRDHHQTKYTWDTKRPPPSQLYLRQESTMLPSISLYLSVSRDRTPPNHQSLSLSPSRGGWVVVSVSVCISLYRYGKGLVGWLFFLLCWFLFIDLSFCLCVYMYRGGRKWEIERERDHKQTN